MAALRQLRRPINLVLDWDGTITQKDTLAIVAEIGYRRQKTANRSHSLPPWSYFGKTYMDDLATHEAAYRPRSEERKTVKQEGAWLASLAPIENASVGRVAESGLFRGVTAADVDDIAYQAVYGTTLPEELTVRLRKGWSALVRKFCQERGSLGTVRILSVNWSERVIHRVLMNVSDGDEHGDSREQHQLVKYVEAMNIMANEIEGLNEPEGSNGQLSKNGRGGIRTSADKLERLRSIQRPTDSAKSPERFAKREAESAPSIVYVGDSATDLECLLAADVGICIRDEPMGIGQKELAATLDRLGVAVLRINESQATNTSATPFVWWARDLQEIADQLV
ncbi:hypothetical protein LTR66_012609 [Elasticomyces elasticus]|nr:hypothetical protein LTR66_012609 [Elasticomyces elasticus]